MNRWIQKHVGRSAPARKFAMRSYKCIYFPSLLKRILFKRTIGSLRISNQFVNHNTHFTIRGRTLRIGMIANTNFIGCCKVLIKIYWREFQRMTGTQISSFNFVGNGIINCCFQDLRL
jgi:hypothetical protein